MYKVFLFVLVVGTILGVGQNFARTQEYVLPEQGIQVVLEVPEKRYELVVSQASTAYQAMGAAQEQGLDFKGRNFLGMGFFVQEINGLRENPRQGKYWIYYINSKKATVGVSTYIVQPYDVISWKYEDEE